ncbi:Uncharacterised protein [Chlamydia trachomatis]|nr:Uncharacterised protein [Chlamydia trachomatis]
MISDMKKPGIVVQSILLICSNNGAPTVPDARLVESDNGDILSPRNAPEMIAPAVIANDKSIAAAIPIKATPIVADVVSELPIQSPISEHTRNVIA